MSKKNQQKQDSALAAPEETLEEIELRRVTLAVSTFRGRILQARSTIIKFKENLDENEASALAWAHSAFAAAARVKVFQDVVFGLTNEDSNPIDSNPIVTRTVDGRPPYNVLPHMRDHAQKEVNRRASHPSRSTSPTSNLMDDEITAAWAEVVEIIDWSY